MRALVKGKKASRSVTASEEQLPSDGEEPSATLRERFLGGLLFVVWLGLLVFVGAQELAIEAVILAVLLLSVTGVGFLGGIAALRRSRKRKLAADFPKATLVTRQERPELSEQSSFPPEREADP